MGQTALTTSQRKDASAQIARARDFVKAIERMGGRVPSGLKTALERLQFAVDTGQDLRRLGRAGEQGPGGARKGSPLRLPRRRQRRGRRVRRRRHPPVADAFRALHPGLQEPEVRDLRDAARDPPPLRPRGDLQVPRRLRPPGAHVLSLVLLAGRRALAAPALRS